MLLFSARKERIINAKSKDIFDILSDITKHPDLAGSGEVLKVRKATEGEVKVGTKFEADENIKFGPKRMKFTATSEVVEYESPTLFSWTSIPPGSPKPKRIQWWFRLNPQNGDTRVIHQVEVEFGLLFTLLMKIPYRLMRGGIIKKGMVKTLDNLKQRAEKKANTEKETTKQV